jgi:transcriptional regulator of acetoin/glycerol metabolism
MNSPSDLKIVVRTIVDTEKKLLIDVLECKWNKTKTAQQLEISRRTLYDEIKKYQIVKTAI